VECQLIDRFVPVSSVSSVGQIGLLVLAVPVDTETKRPERSSNALSAQVGSGSADRFSMEQSATTASVTVSRNVIVRLRCDPCAVAWSGVPASHCWVCGGPGETWNLAVTTYPESGD